MWPIRPGEPPLVSGTHTRRRSSNSLPHHPLAPAPAPAPKTASQAHTRRKSISSTTTNPAPHRLDPSAVHFTPRILPRRIISLNDPPRPQGGRPLPTANPNPNFRSAAEKYVPQAPHRYGGVNLPPVPEFAYGGGNGYGYGGGGRNGNRNVAGGKTVSNSYSLPANLTASYHHAGNSTTKRPNSRPHYHHHHPNNNNNNNNNSNSNSSSSNNSSSRSSGNGNSRLRSSGYVPRVRVSAPQNLDGNLGSSSSSPLEDRETQSSRIVYNYMPSGYWAGRISSIMDRLAAEYPDVALEQRAKMAFGDLLVMACGPGAEQSLMEFKRAFEKKMKDGKI